MFDNKILVITGGTGSFGRAVLKRFLNSGIKEIRIFSRDELKQDNMRREFADSRVRFYIGDVRDRDSLHEPMTNADYVFHAAALKQVPSCEFYPMEAVKTNIIGTENVLDVAVKSRVSKVIVLSTDKAAYPINAMGMSKALMEKVAVAKARSISDSETLIVCTRYGNVMASRGSVIPLFIEQVKRGLELTVTNPDMTRFMMSLDGAVNLVLYAFENGKNGDTFVQKSPGCTVGALAESIGEIFDVDEVRINIIGTRHSEKLYECLLTREEMIRAEESERYYRLPSDSRDLNYSKFVDSGGEFDASISEYTSHNTNQLEKSEIKEMLLNLKELENEWKGLETT